MKAGILKRLQATQAASPPPPPAAAPPPPPEPDPPQDDATSIPLSLPGVELFGDLPWFAELKLRGRLLQEVRQAHAAEKILVGAPAEEIQRILSRKGGQLLAAGAVLRLGGVHHGGYGESDISYAYRQLSRALHPDKNPGIPEVPESKVASFSFPKDFRMMFSFEFPNVLTCRNSFTFVCNGAERHTIPSNALEKQPRHGPKREL